MVWSCSLTFEKQVLEHLPEPALAFVELKRITRPGGDILITAPFTSGSHQQPFHFSSGYSREWYQYFAKKHDLEIIDMVSQGDFFKLLAQEVERGFECGIEIPGVKDPQALQHVRAIMPQYFLQKSKHNTKDTASCFEQFTIGWMVHLRKKK
jgi:SAM-dependent methyltransferase